MVFTQAVAAGKPKNENVRKVAWAYTAILVILALAQLFAFEKFIPIIQSYGLPGGEDIATFVAAVIATVEIFALPFLLRMPLSPLMRWVSLVSAAAVPIIWFALTIVAFVSGLDNGGMFGAKVVTHPVAQLIVVLVLAGLVSVSIWGLHPSKKI